MTERLKKYINISIGILLLGLLSGCGVMLNLFGLGDGITFGIGTFEQGIQEEKDTFKANEDFLMEVYTGKAFGTSEIKIIILKSNNGSEEIYEEWYDYVDPSWNEMLYDFHKVDEFGAFEPGDYIVRMYSDQSDLLAEGMFTIER